MTSPYGDLDRPPLDARALRRALLGHGSAWRRVEVVAESASTNRDLANAAATDADVGGSVLVAEHQTAGRGRLDRSWTAPARSGLTMSAAVRLDRVDGARWPWIPLLAGLAVAAAVRTEASVEATVKWPNDVVVGDRKLAGLLVERVEGLTGPVAVIGIGLNVTMRSDELPVPTATSIALEGGSTTDRSILARSVLRNLDSLLQRWEAVAGDPDQGLRTAYLAACSTIGRDVHVDLPGGARFTGRAVGLDDGGRLLVRTASGERAVGAGDVVHLRDTT